MSEALRFIENEVDKTGEEIKQSIDQKGLNASGKAKGSIRRETDIENNKVDLVGADYIEFLNSGRPPGKFPPVNNMIDWVNIKPVSMQDLKGNEYSANQKAYLVGKGISERGTRIFRDKSKGIQLSVKVADLTERIIEGLPAHAKADVLQQLNKFNKERLSKL